MQYYVSDNKFPTNKNCRHFKKVVSCSVRTFIPGAVYKTIYFFYSISPYPMMLHKYTSESKWPDAVRLCRFVKVRIV